MTEEEKTTILEILQTISVRMGTLSRAVENLINSFKKIEALEEKK